jgi:dynein assembly factor 1
MLPKLNSLYLSHNKLESVGDIEHLKECKSLSVVDLSHNFIEDPDAVQVFSQMENIVIYFHLFLFLNFFNNLACN